VILNIFFKFNRTKKVNKSTKRPNARFLTVITRDKMILQKKKKVIFIN
jgi:hypothetical protein